MPAGVRKLPLSHYMKPFPKATLEGLGGKLSVKLFAPTCQASKHRIVSADKFNDHAVGSQFGGKVDDLIQGNPLTHDHVVYHCQDQHGIKAAERAVKK